MIKFNFNTLLNILLVLVLALFVGRYFYFKPRLIQGEAAPDFSAQTLNGETLRLSDWRGHYVLLDFWGSWCGPCRAENPGLVQLHQKYGAAAFQDAAGFRILSIGVEDNEARWRRAIAQDGLDWPGHIFDQATSLRFFDSEIAALFGVKQVPAKFLLNPKGAIIAVNPSIKELDKLLGSKTAGNG
jgi:thiol-disulfide isomerase/thioredoxin